MYIYYHIYNNRYTYIYIIYIKRFSVRQKAFFVYFERCVVYKVGGAESATFIYNFLNSKAML